MSKYLPALAAILALTAGQAIAQQSPNTTDSTGQQPAGGNSSPAFKQPAGGNSSPAFRQPAGGNSSPAYRQPAGADVSGTIPRQ